MNKICPICNKEFNAHKQKQVFCSIECKWKSQRLSDKKCIICWKVFHPSKSTVKTCSKECWYKSMALWNRKCEYCWKEFTPEHSTNRFCSRECGRKANTFLQDILCPICWKKFKPKNSDIKCCSMHCGQVYNWNNKSEEEKAKTIKRLTNSKVEIISKVNRFYESILNDLWYDVEMEFILWHYSYDLKIWNVLIELNPFAYHNSTWAPDKPWAKIKDKMYHYNKVKCAIDNWYNIIMVRDWMSEDEVIDILYNLYKTKIGGPILHWYNPKTKDHIIDNWYNKAEMMWNWYLEIYDWWEKYIFNSTNLN